MKYYILIAGLLIAAICAIPAASAADNTAQSNDNTINLDQLSQD